MWWGNEEGWISEVRKRWEGDQRSEDVKGRKNRERRESENEIERRWEGERIIREIKGDENRKGKKTLGKE